VFALTSPPLLYTKVRHHEPQAHAHHEHYCNHTTTHSLHNKNSTRYKKTKIQSSIMREPSASSITLVHSVHSVHCREYFHISVQFEYFTKLYGLGSILSLFSTISMRFGALLRIRLWFGFGSFFDSSSNGRIKTRCVSFSGFYC
jgi:hypothetical protein